MSKVQFDMAREKGKSAWLYVVERALGPNPQLYCINNPAQRVNQYLFDDGWQVVSGDTLDTI